MMGRQQTSQEDESYTLSPTGPPLYNEADEKEACIVEWRRRRLERMGFDGLRRDVMARRRDVDLFEAERLVDKGCPHVTAAAILL